MPHRRAARRKSGGSAPSSHTAAAPLGAANVSDAAEGEGLLLAGQLVPLQGGGQGVIVGARIPKDYFLFSGFGEADQGGGVDPWETGSYDLALEAAGIENCNIMQYTSVVPAEAQEVLRSSVQPAMGHGAVVETIMAAINGSQGDRLSAGVAVMKVRRRADQRVLGGYAAEYKGHATEELVKRTLLNDLTEIFRRRYDEQQFEMVDVRSKVAVHEVSKSYGTVIAGLAFTSFILPVVPHGLAPADQHLHAAAAEGGGEEEQG